MYIYIHTPTYIHLDISCKPSGEITRPIFQWNDDGVFTLLGVTPTISLPLVFFFLSISLDFFFFFLAAGRFSLCLFYFILFFYMFHSTSAKCTIYSIPVIITTFFIIIIIRWPLYLTLILHQTRQCLCIYCHFTNK